MAAFIHMFGVTIVEIHERTQKPAWGSMLAGVSLSLLYHRYSVLVDFKNPQGTPSLYVGADVDAGGVKA